MNPIVDVRWPLAPAGQVPLQHQYPLLSALSRIVPEVHRTDGLGIHPIRGMLVNPGKLELTPKSAVTIRTRLEHLPLLMRLSGKKLDLAGCSVRLGVPRVLALPPCPRLFSHLVTIKGYMESVDFSKAIRRQLDTAGIRDSVQAEVGSRRVVRIKQQTIVGFQVAVSGLDDRESVLLQEAGLGGRRHLGCGLFVKADAEGVTSQ